MSQISDTAIINAAGGLVELGYGEILSNVTVSSTTESSGTTVVPAITVVSDGSPVDIEFFSARAVVPGHPSGNYIVFNVVIDGITRGRLGVVYSTGTTQLDVPVHLKFRQTLSAGSHTVAVSAYRYNADCTVAANGTAVNFEMPTFLRVNKIVTASEWPAINEQNRIICTSSTRPSAPYEGIKIYETDTDREFVYTGSAWTLSNAFAVPSCRARPTSNRAFSAGAYIQFDTDSGQGSHDTDDMWDSGDPTKIVIQTPGIYVCNASAYFSGNAGSVESGQIIIMANIGGTDYQTAFNTAAGVNGDSGSLPTCSATLALEAGDFIRIQTYANGTGSGLNILALGTNASATWVGAIP